MIADTEDKMMKRGDGIISKMADVSLAREINACVVELPLVE